MFSAMAVSRITMGLRASSWPDRKSTRLNSSHRCISYAVFCLKTDAVTAAEAHQRAQDYELQVRLYALAVERVAGFSPGRAWLHFLRPNTAVEVDLTPSLLESPEQMVREFQEAQERGEFPLSEGEHCKRCPFYRDLCPAGLG